MIDSQVWLILKSALFNLDYRGADEYANKLTNKYANQLLSTCQMTFIKVWHVKTYCLIGDHGF